jgi:hypothetical protein
MSQSVRATIYPVKDIAKAKALYATLLGTEPYADAPYYVGFRVGDVDSGRWSSRSRRASAPV